MQNLKPSQIAVAIDVVIKAYSSYHLNWGGLGC